jgi:alkylation response protein AidB-like acyl-CoA dehydrogenase
MDFALTPAQHALKARARELADTVFRERAARWDAEEAYPWDNVKDLVRAGFMGITIPPAYGGPGGSVLDVLLVVEEIARVCGVTARIVVEGSLGVVGALTAYGTEEQKRRYLPWVLEGDKPAICITEPEAGSAATDHLATRADEAPGGLRRPARSAGSPARGRRACISCTAASARPGAEGIGGVLVERDAPGFTIGERDRTVGLRGIGGTAAPTAARSRASASSSRRPTGSRSSCARTTASAWARRRWRSASPRAPTSWRWRTRRSAGSSGGPSATSRASAGSSRTWRSRSTRRGS